MRHGLAGDLGLRHQRATGVADWFDTELNQKRVDLRLEREVFAPWADCLIMLTDMSGTFSCWHLQGASRLPWRPLSIFQKPSLFPSPIAIP
jgi:hypothetical protein